MELLIDNDFRDILPPLTDGEYTELENSIKAKGVLSPILVWNGYIVDGHNRYEICCKNGIEVFETKEMQFGSKEEVLEWILSHQLGRRNLNDFQRNEVALKYEKVIAERMKERQLEGQRLGREVRYTGSRPNGQELEPTSRRKELAKIANTSEGSIQRSKLILEHGTQEQIDRARKGGAGNSVSAIAKEITLQQSEGKTKICSKCGKELSVTMFYPNKGYCKRCHNTLTKRCVDIKGNVIAINEKYKNLTEKEVIGDLYDTEKEIDYNSDDLMEEISETIERFNWSVSNVLEMHKDLLSDEDCKKKVFSEIEKLHKRLDELKNMYA